MDWNKLSLPQGARVFRVHNFMYMHKGTSFHLEVDEFSDGTCAGHGEASGDESNQLASVTTDSIEDCLNKLIERIQGQEK